MFEKVEKKKKEYLREKRGSRSSETFCEKTIGLCITVMRVDWQVRTLITNLESFTRRLSFFSYSSFYSFERTMYS